jgi:hypothetical protein
MADANITRDTFNGTFDAFVKALPPQLKEQLAEALQHWENGAINTSGFLFVLRRTVHGKRLPLEHALAFLAQVGR